MKHQKRGCVHCCKSNNLEEDSKIQKNDNEQTMKGEEPIIGEYYEIHFENVPLNS